MRTGDSRAVELLRRCPQRLDLLGQDIQSYLDELDTSPDVETVRVRIAVAVFHNGNYEADSDEGELFLSLVDCSVGHHVVYVEADVPLPARVVVEGEVGE